MMPVEIQMALGRLFRMLSRAARPGDIEAYHSIRTMVLDTAEPQPHDNRPNYVAQRLKGAQGDAP